MVDNELYELFESRKYKRIRDINDLEIYEGLSYIQNETEEITDIYISEDRDELFFIVDAGDLNDPFDLCESIDNKILTFVNFVCKDKQAISKFKYNIVQVVLHSQDNVKRRVENSLDISRKILIYSSGDEKKGINADYFKLPFYLLEDHSNGITFAEWNQLEGLLPSKAEFPFLYEYESPTENEVFVERIRKIRGWLNNDDN